jgi:hypothetical protein
MGGTENSLRHLGLIATSPSWRRHFWRLGRRIYSFWWRRA